MAWLLLKGGASACVSDNSFCTVFAAAMHPPRNDDLLSLLSLWLAERLRNNGFCATEFVPVDDSPDEGLNSITAAVFSVERLNLMQSIRENFIIDKAKHLRSQVEARVQSLIAEDEIMFKAKGSHSCPHPGAGRSFLLDGFFSNTVLERLIRLSEILPQAEQQKQKQRSCSDRLYFCDTEGWVTAALSSALLSALQDSLDFSNPTKVFVFHHMRFLRYKFEGDFLAPHIDLTRTDADSELTSTHTFILYLNDCLLGGGETVLLRSLDGFELKQKLIVETSSAEGPESVVDALDEANILATAVPNVGRLLIFPHRCPHAGLEVKYPPKLLLRGEVYLKFK